MDRDTICRRAGVDAEENRIRLSLPASTWSGARARGTLSTSKDHFRATFRIATSIPLPCERLRVSRPGDLRPLQGRSVHSWRARVTQAHPISASWPCWPVRCSIPSEDSCHLGDTCPLCRGPSYPHQLSTPRRVLKFGLPGLAPFRQLTSGSTSSKEMAADRELGTLKRGSACEKNCGTSRKTGVRYRPELGPSPRSAMRFMVHTIRFMRGADLKPLS